MKIPSRVKTIFFVLLISSIGMSLFITKLDNSDPVIKEVESFLNANGDIHKLVGHVRSYSVTNRIYFQGTNDLLPYNEYRLHVEGDKATAWITVRATKSVADDKVQNFSIIHSKIE